MIKTTKDIDELCPWLTRKLNHKQKESVCIMVNEMGLGNFLICGKLLAEIIHENYDKAINLISNMPNFKDSINLKIICDNLMSKKNI